MVCDFKVFSKDVLMGVITWLISYLVCIEVGP